MTAYVPARLHDTPTGPELELYGPPLACGQYQAFDTAAEAQRVLDAGGAAGGWAAVRVESGAER